MSADEFRVVAEKIKPFTDYVYLHVLGEPLLHPQLEDILMICKKSGLYVNITTNGSLLLKKKELLLQNPVRQINISLHDAEENIPEEKWKDFINEILQTANELSKNSYINFRLWNQRNDEILEFNNLVTDMMMGFFPIFETNGRNVTLAHNVYLQTAPRFEWIEKKQSENKTCYALKNHIAILSDGSVVPCCMDADANLRLGNIFNENLADILHVEKAQRILKGFAQHKAVETWCRMCGFKL